jgi:hypothetical protein
MLFGRRGFDDMGGVQRVRRAQDHGVDGFVREKILEGRMEPQSERIRLCRAVTIDVGCGRNAELFAPSHHAQDGAAPPAKTDNARIQHAS